MKNMKKEITQELLKEYFNYDPVTGEFTWIKKPAQCIKIGDIAGNITTTRYRSIKFFNKGYQVHRLVWLYIHVSFPSDNKEIDHINGIRDDNRLINLREATRAQNQHNKPISKNNTSGCKGVMWNKSEEKWRASISFNNLRKHLGSFNTKEEAIKARKDAEKQYHKEFART